MMIEKKIWPEFFDDVKKGKKKFEIRLADFRCKTGDILHLREWSPQTKEYTGRQIKKKVKSVYRAKDLKFWLKKDIEKYGLQIIGLE